MRRIPQLALIIALAFQTAGTAQDVNPSAKKEKDKRQIDWVGDWDTAFKQAKEANRVVMVCINSKDGEGANERAAGETYKDEDFVALTRKFVMIVVSTRDHSGMFGSCKRFGGVTCQQHVDCYKLLRNNFGEQFLLDGNKGEMISPQHAWFSSAGKLIYRKEYELKKPDLMKRMRAVLAEQAGKTVEEIEAETRGDAATKPLTEKDKMELERVKGKKEEHRRAAVGNLLRTGKRAAVTALVDLLLETKKTFVKCDIMRGLGKGNVVDAREAIEDHLTHKDEDVRGFAAVALEELARPESIEPLLKRAKKERSHHPRKNMYRALAKCGGPSANEKVAKALLKAVSSDKQQMIRKQIGAALKAFNNEKGRKLVKKKLESIVMKEKDGWALGAQVYALAYVGDLETTLPLFLKILSKSNDERRKGWLREAISVLKKRGNFRTTWWIWSEDSDDPAREVEDRGWGGRGGR